MSFSGFVFDMIGRDKANRDLLKSRRERRKELRGKICKPGETHPELNITLAEFEQIQKDTKEKERQEQKYHLRYACIFLGCAVVVFVLVWAAVKFWF